jgi:predicted CXXCH cytochrome family protein
MRTPVRWALLAVLPVIAVAGAAWWLATHRAEIEPGGAASKPLVHAPVIEARYVGSDRCASCHERETRAWAGSQHQHAMQKADANTVLGDFGDRTFTYAGATSRFRRDGDRFLVRTDGPDGKLADFPVEYTFGVAPLQQYLVELARGHLQAISIAWDSRPHEVGGQRWFHLYPHERIDFRDQLHWTRLAQNWNYMCADCHSTDVRKNYDAATDTYRTTWSEISVGCEACHGPGSTHVEWARKRAPDPTLGLVSRLDERKGIVWRRDVGTGQPVRSAPRTSRREIEVCAQCHARRAQIADGYRAGDAFLDHYLPSFLVSPLYYADGQQRDEVYVWGSFLQSRMHAAGVTCSDCHDPHTQKLRAPGNAVCAQCHDAARYDTTAHHHHRAGSSGAACADCHMPRTTYMVVDGRRDHSLRVPRPDETVRFGVPNACNGCHRDRDANWAAAAVHAWLGRDARGFQGFAPLFAANDAGDPRALGGLRDVATSDRDPSIVRASAAERLASAPRVAVDGALVERLASDRDDLVRLAAVQLAARLDGNSAAQVLAALLADPRKAIRTEAARELAGMQSRLQEPVQTAWRKAADEYVASLRYNADRPESRVALGNYFGALGQASAARDAFESAIALDPQFVPAYVNAADLLRSEGQDAEAAMLLQRGLVQVPKDAALHHALGLTQVRLGQRSAALASLQSAARLAPDSSRYAYVYAVALQSSGQSGQSRKLLAQATRRWPHDYDLWFALASFEAQAGHVDTAREAARHLLAEYPGDRDARQLAQQLATP